MIGGDTRMLVLAPHVDDELNCGGLIARVTASGGSACIAAFSPCYGSIPAELAGKDIREEFRKSCQVLRADGEIFDFPVRRFQEHRNDIRELIFKLTRDVSHNLVAIPSSTDLHQDHQVIHEEAMRVLRNAPYLLGWDSPNNQRRATLNTFVELSHAALGEKIEAWFCYETQHHRTHYDMGYWMDLAGTRGRQCRCQSQLAEAYEHLGAVL